MVSGVARGGESDINDLARSLVEKHKDAVVLVEVVVKVKASQGGQSREREHKMEANGTVISPDGLTVVSNSTIDPSAMYERFQVKADASVTGAKIILADGTEHEAKVILTDKDLDMAFVRPKAKVSLPCIEMAKTGPLKLLDGLIAITRLDRKSNREPGAAVSQVLSVISKPRLSYMATGHVFQGCPVFNAQGLVLGLALSRSGAPGLLVLPCEDVLEAAAQVPAPGSEKEPETGAAGALPDQLPVATDGKAVGVPEKKGAPDADGE
jgi:S1-C subfamily serine protease